MTKKKIVSLSLVIALLATLVVGGTMAYFTDKDTETNTFTVGNVDIDLVEDFIDGSELMPGIDVKKEAKIVNEGPNDAIVWAEVLVPELLDDGIANSPNAPGAENSLHVNYPGAFSLGHAQNNNADAKWYNADLSKLWVHQHNDDNVAYGFIGTETIDGVKYNKYVKFYTEVLEPTKETSLFLNKVYMDSKVSQCVAKDCKCEGKGYTLADKKTCYNGVWDVVVRAYAIQAEGFVDEDGKPDYIKAWKAYDGAKFDGTKAE